MQKHTLLCKEWEWGTNGWSFSDQLMLKIQESVLKERCKVDTSSSRTKLYPYFWATDISQLYNPKQNKRMFLYLPEALNTQTASEVNRNYALNMCYPHFPPQVVKVQFSQQLNVYFGRKAIRGWQTKLNTFWCSHALKTNKNWHLPLYTHTPPPPGNAHNAPLHIHHRTKPHVVFSLCKVPSLLIEGTLHQPRSLPSLRATKYFFCCLQFLATSAWVQIYQRLLDFLMSDFSF